jgi:LemA protein
MDTAQIAWLVGAIVLGLWIFGAYNRLVALRGAIVAAWQQVEEAIQRRERLVAPLALRLRDTLADSHGVLDAVVASLAQCQADVATVNRRPLAHADAIASLAAHEVALGEALADMHRAIERRPALRDDAPLAAARAEIDAAVTRVTATRQWFNDAAAAYDSAIAQLPTRALMPLFGFRRIGRL